jgi:hypothetical protein
VPLINKKRSIKRIMKGNKNLDYYFHHKVLTYLEYRAVKAGGGCKGVRGWGVNISEDARH